MKAYFVETDDDGTGEIVWCDDIDQHADRAEWYSTRRAPEFDQYCEQGWVPAEAWIKWGGWLSCPECGQHVTPELWNYDEDEPIDPVYINSSAFCSLSCYELTQSKAQATRKRRAELLDQFNSLGLPATAFIGRHFYATEANRIDFTFEGGKGYWNAAQPNEVLIAPIYLDAWEKAKTAINPTAKLLRIER